MSVLDSMMAEMGGPLLLEQLGTSVNYHAVDGAGEEVTLGVMASVGPIEQVPRETERGVVYDSVRSIAMSRDPAAPTKGIADPELGDKVTIAGEAWYVRNLDSVSGSMFRATLIRREAHEVGKVRYRGA